MKQLRAITKDAAHPIKKVLVDSYDDDDLPMVEHRLRELGGDVLIRAHNVDLTTTYNPDLDVTDILSYAISPNVLTVHSNFSMAESHVVDTLRSRPYGAYLVIDEGNVEAYVYSDMQAKAVLHENIPL